VLDHVGGFTCVECAVGVKLPDDVAELRADQIRSGQAMPAS
jgi:hypothetical protein